MDKTDTRVLRAAADRAGRRPAFVAYDLARFYDIVDGDPASWLGLDEEAVSRLALCRTPRRGAHFGHDVIAIGGHVGVDPVRFASLIRMLEVVSELQLSASKVVEIADADSVGAVVLAAARDETDEHTVLSDTPLAGPGLPGWLHDAVNRFWADAPAAATYPRDLDFAVLVGLPLAVVELPQLSVGAIAEWLTSHKVELLLSGPDRRVRACLVALGGVGLVFVDSEDDTTQRRVSLAHEAAHFVVEYLLPHQEVARRRPDLLAVVDGQRQPTAQERLVAILRDIPIGVHAHLLDRDDHGGHRVDIAEWRARRVALELLAPQAVVEHRIQAGAARGRDAVRQMLVDDFGLPVSLAADYAEQLISTSDPSKPGLLDLLGKRDPGSATERKVGHHETDRSPKPMPEEK